MNPGKGLLAEVVLHLTCVRRRVLRRDAQKREQLREGPVAVIDPAGNLHAAVIESDQAVRRHGDIAVFPQFFHGNADAGLGVAQFVDNVNGTHGTTPVPQDQYGFQIVLRGLMDGHRRSLLS